MIGLPLNRQLKALWCCNPFNNSNRQVSFIELGTLFNMKFNKFINLIGDIISLIEGPPGNSIGFHGFFNRNSLIIIKLFPLLLIYPSSNGLTPNIGQAKSG